MNRRTALIFLAVPFFASRQANAACYQPVKDVAPAILNEAIDLLAKNIYFHRGVTNTEEGKRAITAVVFNRVSDCAHTWLRTIRGVIKGGASRGKNCDFSWYCDGMDDVPDDPNRFANDQKLATKWIVEHLAGTFEDPTYGATWFIYKEDPLPRSWEQYNLTEVGIFGHYRFYRF